MAITVWKVLAGAATGVAAVVALPIAGPIGAITAVGALAAGGIGAAAGAIAGSADDSEERAEKRGENRANAEHALKIAKMNENFKKMEANLNEVNDYHNVLIAMTALAMACANCDGEINPSERLEIMEFIGGASGTALPANVKSKLNALADNPPSLNEVALIIKELPRMDSYDVFDDIVELTIHADGIFHPNEKKFLADWNNVKKLIA